MLFHLGIFIIQIGCQCLAGCCTTDVDTGIGGSRFGWCAAAVFTFDYRDYKAGVRPDMKSEGTGQVSRQPGDFTPHVRRGSCGGCTSWVYNIAPSGCAVSSDTSIILLG